MHTRIEASCRLRMILAALLVVVLPAQVGAAVIPVDGNCSLAAAIDAANRDDDAGGACLPGGSGADTLELRGDVVLLSSLPEIDSEITIRGNGFTVRRDPAAPPFGIFRALGGHLTLEDVVVTGGDAGSGGAVFNNAQVTVTSSTLSGNSASAGGAIYNYGGRIIVNSSTISGNSATSRGGAILTSGSLDALTIRDSTLSNNRVSGAGGAPGHSAGGAIFVYYGGATLTNATLSGNSIAAGNGGGVFNYYGNVTITSSTVSGNSSSGGYIGGGGIGSYIADTIVQNSIIANSGGLNCALSYPLIDLGNNFDDDGSCGPDFGALTGLEPVLADNGGPTQTHALLAGSSAIDAAGDCSTDTDQRGFDRVGDCDSGAYEFGAVAPGVGGATTGVRAIRAICGNRSTPSRVVIALAGATAWNCETEGLVVAPGDRIEMVAVGRASSGSEAVGGSVTGMSPVSVLCSNRTTNQDVEVPLGAGEPSWDCQAAGLLASEGDRIRMLVRAAAD